MFSIQNIGNYILSRVTQEDIFHRYLYIRPVIKKLICSPSILRVDKNPTCEFRWSNGWLRLIDYGGYFSGNCFDVVMKLYNVNYYEACEIIKRDFTLDKREASVEYSTKKKQEKGTSGINAQAFTETDKLYWDKYYCEEQILRDKFFVYSCKNIYWNGKIIYTYTSSDPGYGYYFGNGNGNSISLSGKSIDLCKIQRVLKA